MAKPQDPELAKTPTNASGKPLKLKPLANAQLRTSSTQTLQQTDILREEDAFELKNELNALKQDFSRQNRFIAEELNGLKNRVRKDIAEGPMRAR